MKKYTGNDDIAVMSKDEVRSFDKWAIETAGVPGVVLMENAGRSCAELIADKLTQADGSSAAIFCGTGNNGGDGFVIARHLANRGYDVRILICGDANKIKGDAAVNCAIAEKMHLNIIQLSLNDEKINEHIAEHCRQADIMVDAIFGTGLAGQLKPEYQRLIRAINQANKPIVSVDIPSGLDCDSAVVMGQAVKATETVSFAAAKKGFTLEKAREFTGQIYVASIGIEPEFRII